MVEYYTNQNSMDYFCGLLLWLFYFAIWTKYFIACANFDESDTEL